MNSSQTGQPDHKAAPAVICRLPESSCKILAAIDAECNFPAWIEGQFKAEFSKEGALIMGARAAGQIVGFLVIECVADEAHLMNFGVLPSARRSGTGRILLFSALAEIYAAGVHVITLEVRAGNSAARSLYLKTGFEEVSIRQGYYSENREDGIIARLDLSDFIERKRSELKELGITG